MNTTMKWNYVSREGQKIHVEYPVSYIVRGVKRQMGCIQRLSLVKLEIVGTSNTNFTSH